MKHFKLPLRGIISTGLLVGFLASAAPAQAETATTLYVIGPTTTTTPAAPIQDTSGTNLTPEQLSSRYASLSSAWVAYHAQLAGQTLEQYAAGNQTEVSGLFGPAASNLFGSSSQPQTLAQLNSELASKGLTLNSQGFTSLTQMASALAARPQTLDASAVASGATYAQTLSAMLSTYGHLTTPALTMPTVSGQALQGSLSSDSLAVGYFFDKVGTVFATDHPDLLSSGASPSLDPQNQQAWDSAMDSAVSAMQADATSGLVNHCQAAMLQAAAGQTAAAATNGCSACLTAGEYLQPQVASLLSGAMTSGTGAMSMTQWTNLDAGTQQTIEKANPNFASQLAQQQAAANAAPAAQAACQSAQGAINGSFGSSLDGVLSRLNG